MLKPVLVLPTKDCSAGMENKMKENFNQSDPYPALQDWDLMPFESNVKIFHANQEMKESHVNLTVKRIFRENKRLSNEKKELQTNKRKLKKQFMAADKVIRDNRASMFRFNEKIKNYIHEQIALQAQIANMKLELAKYPEIKEEMEKYVKEYSFLFKDFLEKVAQNTKEFNSVHDVLNRYETLEKCRQDCTKMLKTEIDEASSLREKLMNLMQSKFIILKKLENSQTTLELRRKQAFDHRHTWDNVLKHIQSLIANQITQSVALQNGCYDLYLEISRRRESKKTVGKENTKEQLNYIQNSLVFYKEVLRIATVLTQKYQVPGVKDVPSEKSLSKPDVFKNLLQKAEEGKISTDENMNANRKTTSMLSNMNVNRKTTSSILSSLKPKQSVQSNFKN